MSFVAGADGENLAIAGRNEVEDLNRSSQQKIPNAFQQNFYYSSMFFELQRKFHILKISFNKTCNY